MKIIRDIKRVDGKLPSLEGHRDLCAYGVNRDGSDALICVCPPGKKPEVKKVAKKKIEAPIIKKVITKEEAMDVIEESTEEVIETVEDFFIAPNKFK